MGLDITRMESTLKVDWGYSMLHRVRWLAAMSCGFRGDFEKFKKIERYEGTWTKWPDYHQLMHFSDSEGVFVREYHLDGVEYKESFQLGSYDKLKAEVVRLRGWVQARQCRLVGNRGIETWDIEAVEELYHLLVDDNGVEVLLFH